MKTEQKELLFKALCGYLPYELKIKSPKHLEYNLELSAHQGFGWLWIGITDLIKRIDLSNNIFKPILRPLDDLTKEITHNGETFVPIKQLFKMIDSSDYVDWYYFLDGELAKCLDSSHTKIDDDWNHCLTLNHPKSDEEDDSICLSVTSGNICLFDNYTETDMRIMNERHLFDYLQSLHFDIYGLIEQNLAIDINIIEK